MLQLQLSHPDFPTTDLSSVELILWGGAAMPRDGIRELQKLGARLLTAYGMTETSAHATYSEEDADIDVLAESVGKPDSRIPCRIMTDLGEPTKVGETGELQFHGELMMLEYWKRPEATGAAFTQDGWLKTGDTGFWREDGNIQLVGRVSEMFKSGGYNVYPREVEIALEELPAVAMAAVISVPDELYQEVGHAYLLLEAGQDVSEDELRAFCRERLANYKVPKRFFPWRELPMLPVGKIDKQRLRRAESDPRAEGATTTEQM
jgi:acyl-CoA synthetase (AMP-forming)/AMP-acid ligase II